MLPVTQANQGYAVTFGVQFPRGHSSTTVHVCWTKLVVDGRRGLGLARRTTALVQTMMHVRSLDGSAWAGTMVAGTGKKNASVPTTYYDERHCLTLHVRHGFLGKKETRAAKLR